MPKFFQINPALQRFYKKGDSVIETPNHGKIYIRSTENPNVLEGMTLRWAWLDEAGQMKREAWINIQGRLSIKQGRCFITTTPYNMGWLYTEFYEPWKAGNKDYRVVQFKSIDSPYFPKEEFERVKNTMDRRTFERRYCGEFQKMEGLVYDEFNINFHVVDNLPEKFDMTIAGIDWGYTAPSAIAIFGTHDNVFYLIDEYYETKKTTQELVEVAKNLKEKYNISRFYADGAEPDRIEEFKRNGLYTLEGNKDIILGVNKVRQLIKESKFLVSRKCVNFLDEIERYHYPEVKDNRGSDEIPEKVDDHLCDASRYCLATFQPVPRRPQSTKAQAYYKRPAFGNI